MHIIRNLGELRELLKDLPDDTRVGAWSTWLDTEIVTDELEVDIRTDVSPPQVVFS